MSKWFHCTRYWAHDHLSILELKLICISKRDPRDKCTTGWDEWCLLRISIKNIYWNECTQMTKPSFVADVPVTVFHENLKVWLSTDMISTLCRHREASVVEECITIVFSRETLSHDGDIIWSRFPHQWPFRWESIVNLHHNGTEVRRLDILCCKHYHIPRQTINLLVALMALAVVSSDM